MTRLTLDKAKDISISANIYIHWHANDGGVLSILLFSFEEREKQMVVDCLLLDGHLLTITVSRLWIPLATTCSGKKCAHFKTTKIIFTLVFTNH